MKFDHAGQTRSHLTLSMGGLDPPKADAAPAFGFVYVDQASFEAHKPGSFAALAASFREYQGD